MAGLSWTVYINFKVLSLCRNKSPYCKLLSPAVMKNTFLVFPDRIHPFLSIPYF